jgi:uncharacterized protein YndB with AHSA1/START domain
MDRAHFDPGPLAEVAAFEEPNGGWTVVFTRDLDHPPTSVWEALTDPDELREWAPYTADRNLDGLGPATLQMLGGVDLGGDLPGTVTRADAPEVLEYTWGDDTLRFELRAEDDGKTTVLDLVDVLEDVGKGARDGAGWHVCLDSLEQHLRGEPTRTQDEDVWKPVHEAYVKQFPPEASTIGVPDSKDS